MYRKIFYLSFIFVFSLFLLVGCTVKVFDDSDPNSLTVIEDNNLNAESDNKNTIPAGSDSSDSFHEGDVDFYKFSVGPGDSFKLMVYPERNLDVKLNIYDSGGKDGTWDFTYSYGGSTKGTSAFKIDSAIEGKEEGFWSQVNSDKDSNTFYFSVTQVKGLGKYQMTLEVASQNDGNSGRDAGDKPVDAVSISDSGSGLLNWNDKVDCIKFDSPRSQVTVSPSKDLDVSLTIHDSGGKDVTWDLTYYKKTNKKGSMFKVNDADTGLPEIISWGAEDIKFVCIEKKSGFGDYTIS